MIRRKVQIAFYCFFMLVVAMPAFSQQGNESFIEDWTTPIQNSWNPYQPTFQLPTEVFNTPGFGSDVDDVPIDGGLSLLLTAGLSYGLRRIKRKDTKAAAKQ